jgi:anthraniloyl-CoA monooxygenase
MRINVIGGGPAGLLFSILMKKLDLAHEIVVHERNAADETYGWGVVMSRGALARLRGCDFETYVELMRIARTWSDVHVIHRGERVAVAGNHFAGVKRISFLRILQARAQDLGVDVRFGSEIAHPADVSDCDLVVGADGVGSVVREAHKAEFQADVEHRRNKYIWLGTRQVFPALTMGFREHSDGLYIFHAYKFDDEMSTFIVECDPDTWEAGGFADRTAEESCAYLEDVFRSELGEHRLESNKSRWIHFALVRCNRWYHDNVVLLGDALHTAHFSIGSGTKLAVEDAMALAGGFAESDSVPQALAAFERARKPKVDAFQDAAIDSLSWLETCAADMSMEPLAFTHRLMSRSGRISHRRLGEQDPAFAARYEAWRWANEGPIPAAFLDLFEKRAHGHLATLMADGTPHVTPVWVDYDGEHLLINSARGRQKDLNMDRRRHVAIEIMDPDNPNRYVAVRGSVVEITEEGADAHLDSLAGRYLGEDRYPPSWRFPGEVRRLYRVRPLKVTGWDPFGGW